MRGRGSSRTPRSSAGRGWAIALVLCLIVAAGLTFLHVRRDRAHRSDPVVGFLRDRTLAPPQGVVLGMSRWWRIHVASAWQAPRLARENAALQMQLLALEAENKQLRAAQNENNALRRELGYERRSPLPLLPAEVLALKPNPLMDTLTLNRGTSSHVHLSQPVLSPNGVLIGQVLDVTPRSCTVLLLTDAESAAGAEIVRPGANPATAASRIGICRGDRAGRLILTIPRIDADIRPGDAVVTSNLGTIFPKGLPIGTVQSVTTDRTLAVRQALLRPGADFDHLEQAFLIQ